MKTAVVFYSFSGNTRKLARFLGAYAKEQGVELFDLKLEKEEKSFLGQCRDARKKLSPPLAGFAFDPQKYDMIIFASPVWAFTFAPALRSALGAIASLAGKKAAAIITCGSGLGTKKAVQEMETMLKQKGAEVVFAGFAKGHKCSDAVYLQEQLSGLFAAMQNAK